MVAKENPSDERLIALAEVRDVTTQLNEDGEVVRVPAIERTLAACLDGIRRAQAQRGKKRLDNNRVVLFVWPVLDIPQTVSPAIARRIAPLTVNAGLEEVTILASVKDDRDVAAAAEWRFASRTAPGAGIVANVTEPPTEPLRPLDEYAQKVQRSQARGTVYPYELIPLLTGSEGSVRRVRLRRVRRACTGRPAVWTQHGRAHRRRGDAADGRYPEGMTRVALFGDPTKALGTVAEAECARVVAAIDLAEKLSVPVEWFALSSGATISMDSGTENMDWVSRRCAGSSRSPRTVVRSTSSSRVSTSARSRTGMPKRRC